MDSKKRHELETNDLREFLDNFKDFWDKNGNSILIALIVLVGGFTAYRWYRGNQHEKAETSSQALVDATTGAQLLGAAEEYSQTAHSARLRAGDLYLEAARSAAAKGDDAEAIKELDNAALAYQGVLDAEKYLEHRINAHLGLAAVAEMRGDWDQAHASYDAAADLAGDRYRRLATVAQLGQSKVDDLRDIIPFGSDVLDLPPTTPMPDPNDLDGDGIPGFIDRPDDTPGTTPGGVPGFDPLFPEDDPALPGSGDGGEEPIEFDPLLQPGSGE